MSGGPQMAADIAAATLDDARHLAALLDAVLDARAAAEDAQREADRMTRIAAEAVSRASAALHAEGLITLEYGHQFPDYLRARREARS